MTNSFLANIDRNFSYERSIILRYRKCVFPAVWGDKKISLDTDILQETSMLEGVGIYPLIDYKGVKIRILDETSRMASGTFKSIDACLSMAISKSQGIKKLVFESGGNTGSAFSSYASMLKMRTFFVVPLANVRLLSQESFFKPYNYIVAVKNPQDVKIVSEKLSKTVSGCHRIPKLEWRYLAATFRGYRILEYLMEEQDVDWLSQTVSAGFGPIGIYKVLERHRDDLRKMPRFLGVQQAENCPYYKKIMEGKSEQEVHCAKDLLIPVMYDSQPFSYKAFDDFKNIMDARGKMLTIDRGEFNVFSGKYLDVQGITEILEEHQTFIYKENDDIVDKAGLVGLAGVFKAIDSKVIKKGETVLHSLSSGTFRRKCAPTPDCVIDGTQSLDARLDLFVGSLEKNRAYDTR